jgi:hypothetical protein
VTKVTELEKDVLINGLYGSEFNDTSVEDIEKEGYNRWNAILVWRECVVDCCKIVTKTNISGVISSLSKKGLVFCEGEKRDAVVGISEEGLKEIKEILRGEETNE